MLAPLTEKVGFYDAQGAALWISDGVEEPELRACVEALLVRHARESPTAPTERHGSPLNALPIRGVDGSLLGALGLALRGGGDVSHTMRSSTTERLLAPLLEIIAYGWRRDGTPRSTPAPAPEPRERPAPNPAVLRRTLALAIERIECAFGAIVLANRPFTFSHRVSTEDSDVTVNAVVDAVRDPMLKVMRVRREPLIANRIADARLLSAPFKLLVYPVRSPDERLIALILLFRKTHERDFVLWDVEALQEIGDDLCLDVLTASVAGRAPPAAEPPVPLVQEQRPTARAASALALETRIRQALVHGGFDLHAQHIAGLRADSHPHRFEVLLRMHDAGKLRAPGAFFGAAQAQKLMPELDRWVIRTLLQRLRPHAQTVRSGQWEFCLNVAGQSLTDEGFSEFVVAEVCRSTVPPGLLVFEFSEGSALEHGRAIEVMAARLRDVGCRIALDNCRAGFETLSTLRKWPVSRVKIDGVLTREVISSARAEALVRAVVQLAAGVGVETVAECVESEAVRAKLLDIGVDYAQGFHLAKPQSLASVLPK